MHGVVEQVRALRRALGDVDPASLPGSECAVLVEELAAVENVCAGVRAAAALRAAACGMDRERGHHDAASWLSRVSGTSSGDAKAALDVASSLAERPLVRHAVARGELSLAQAKAVVDAARVAPHCDRGLVEVARTRGLRELRDAARKARLGGVEPAVLYEAQRAARAFSHWRDELGMVCLRARLLPEVGIPFVRRLEAETDRLRRASTRKEPRAAHMADAVGSVASHGTGGARTGRSRTDLVIVCDLRAWRRGHVEAGETCHVVGGGPLPVSVAQRHAVDAFVKAVVHDGVEIKTVSHLGRHLPAELRTALELGPPPTFDGAECVDCGRRDGLEFDHVVPFARGGPTSLANLKPRCWPHHQVKTEHDRAAGRIGPRGRRDEPP